MWMPSAPPGESPQEAVEKNKAVAELLARLGPETEPRVLAEHLKRSALEEVAAIQKELRERAAKSPRPDQSPPQKARRPGVGEPDEVAAPSGVPEAACPCHPTWTAARTAH